jgi:electron-transferring-flavoprotein dehydrogenase
MSRESISFDVLIIGAGPAGLSAAIRLSQLSESQHRTLSICVLEKAAQVGEHSLSGAVLDPKALNELLPDWKSLGAPLNTPVTHDEFSLLTPQKKWRLPVSTAMQNAGNYIIRLSHFCRWLSGQAEAHGVSIFSGFAAVALLYDASGRVCGVTTGDKGLDKNGQPTARYQPGIDITAKQTLLAEGCRGSLTKTAIQRFGLYKTHQHQTYAIGVKELWEIPAAQHTPGAVMHSVGWPLDSRTYGGSFLYHLEKQQVAVGLIIGLDYKNPYLDPYEELQRFKTHPAIRPIFANGKCVAYGAKALNEGGFQSIPTLHFPGGLLIGDAGGFVNALRIKGIHTSMKSGMLAAEVLMSADDLAAEPAHFNQVILQSWVGEELSLARNIRPAFHRWGLWGGLGYSAMDHYLFKGKAPWTLQHQKPDYACLKEANKTTPIIYPPHDHVLTFDKSSAVYLSNTHHEENQPCHLVLKNPALAIDINDKLYDSPEIRYCPAGVYDIVDKDTKPRLQINATNCIHCKTCDIKDPTQNINWQPPEGGDGPNYSEM